MNRLLLRRIHRWLGLFAGIQLLAWTLSGFYFTWYPLEHIWGKHVLNPESNMPVVGDHELLSISEVINAHPELSNERIDTVSLESHLGVPTFSIADRKFNAVTGEEIGHLTEAEVLSVIRSRTDADVLVIELIESLEPDSEIRGGELPAWRIEIDHPENPVLYVGANSGKITATRTDAWRWFDLMWMFHVMDYEKRTNFNHLLIQVMAALGICTVLSGLTLFFVTLRLNRYHR